MARKLRVEIEGGLYHVITRGNDRQDVFHCPEDFQKFIALLAKQKDRSGFFLYAYCLMTNHAHLLLERQKETVGNIMQRVLTGYSQYYNRRYKRVGHVFQGRHKAILCESQTYLAKLVRYIHLNPVRARMVSAPEEYPYSSHQAYVGQEEPGIVDVDPVLRHFGSRREAAIRNFLEFMGMPIIDDESQYSSAENDVLGCEEFIDATIHRLGNVEHPLARSREPKPTFEAAKLITAVERVFGLRAVEFCGSCKDARAVMAKEVLILAGRNAGASVTQLSEIVGLDISTVSRRYETALRKLRINSKLAYARDLVERGYSGRIAELQD